MKTFCFKDGGYGFSIFMTLCVFVWILQLFSVQTIPILSSDTSSLIDLGNELEESTENMQTIQKNETNSKNTTVATPTSSPLPPPPPPPPSTAPFNSPKQEVCYRWRKPVPTQNKLSLDRVGMSSWNEGNKVYVFGGCRAVRPQALPTLCYNDLYQLSLLTRQWKKLNISAATHDHPIERYGAASAYSSTTRKLYLYGGYAIGPQKPTQPFDITAPVERSVPPSIANSLDCLTFGSKDAWRYEHVPARGRQPLPAADAALTIVQNHIVLFGGYSESYYHNSLYFLLIDTEDGKYSKDDLLKWTEANTNQQDAPQPRRGHSLSYQISEATKSVKLYVFGGINAKGDLLNDLYVVSIPFSWSTSPQWIWKKIAYSTVTLPLPVVKPTNKKANNTQPVIPYVPPPRAYHASIFVDDLIVTIGGCGAKSCYSDIVLYNPATNTWFSTPSNLLEVPPPPPPYSSETPAAIFANKDIYTYENNTRLMSARGRLAIGSVVGNKLAIVGGCNVGVLNVTRNGLTDCADDLLFLDTKSICSFTKCGPQGLLLTKEEQEKKERIAMGGTANAAKAKILVTSSKEEITEALLDDDEWVDDEQAESYYNLTVAYEKRFQQEYNRPKEEGNEINIFGNKKKKRVVLPPLPSAFVSVKVKKTELFYDPEDEDENLEIVQERRKELKYGLRCMCINGYVGKFCQIKSPCPNNCSGRKQGICRMRQGKPECQCRNGYWGPDCSLAPCPNNCSSHGVCKIVNPPSVPIEEYDMELETVCSCEPGWSGTDCSRHNATVAKDASKVCKDHCSGHGRCVRDTISLFLATTSVTTTQSKQPQQKEKTSAIVPEYICDCEKGFGGDECDVPCPNFCNGRGVCDYLTRTCSCDRGYTGTACEKTYCYGNCSNHGKCVNNKCVCNPGYLGIACEIDATCSFRGKWNNGVCACDNGFLFRDCSGILSCSVHNCSNHGLCRPKDHTLALLMINDTTLTKIPYVNGTTSLNTATKEEKNDKINVIAGECLCNAGYIGDKCQQKMCPRNCNNHGSCSIDGKCTCKAGYMGDDCGISIQCVGNCTDERHGDCVYDKTKPTVKNGVVSGSCKCKDDWVGIDCSIIKLTCVGPNCQCPGLTMMGACSGHGICVRGICACEPGYSGSDCSAITVKSLLNGPCPRNCSDRGVCYLEKCFCLPGYYGVDCSVESNTNAGCPLSCSGRPPTYDQRGICHLGQCFCNPGYSGSGCEVEDKCPKNCHQNGICAYGKCFCIAGYTGPECNIPLDPVLQQALIQDEMKQIVQRKVGCGGCSMHGICVNNKCACEAGYTGPDCSTIVGGILSHRCPNDCSERGLCMFGKCFCFPGFTGHGCEIIQSLPCPNNCNYKGICRYGKCFCYPGYDGADCKQAHDCSKECGTHGVCSEGRCICASGFTGEKCNIALPPPPKSTSTSATGNKDTQKDDSSAQLLKFKQVYSGSPEPAYEGADHASSRLSNVDDSFTEVSSQAKVDAAAVVVTDTQFPTTVLVLIGFLTGAMVSAFFGFLVNKRQQMQRQHQILHPLLNSK